MNVLNIQIRFFNAYCFNVKSAICFGTDY